MINHATYQFTSSARRTPLLHARHILFLYACGDSPPIISSLVGYNNAKSWDGLKWNDLSDNIKDVTSITGTVTLQSFDTISGLDALTGSTIDGCIDG